MKLWMYFADLGMDSFIELLKPCLVLIGPLLFFACKRAKEYQDTRKLKVHVLTVQDFVEKLTKTPRHTKNIQIKYNNERLALFEKERNLQKRCKALESMLQYEIARNEYLNKMCNEQVMLQRKLLKEIFCMRAAVKRLRRSRRRRKIVTSVRRHQSLFYDDAGETANACKCQYCIQHLLLRETRVPCHCQSMQEEAQFDNGSTEDTDAHDLERSDQSLTSQVNNDSLDCNWRLHKDNQFDYYQTYFSEFQKFS